MFENRPRDDGRHILPWCITIAPLARRFLRVAVTVIVPIGVQRVMSHHEAHSHFRRFIVDQHHFLVMGGFRTVCTNSPGCWAIAASPHELFPIHDLHAVVQREVTRHQFDADIPEGLRTEHLVRVLSECGIHLRSGRRCTRRFAACRQPGIVIPVPVVGDLICILVLRHEPHTVGPPRHLLFADLRDPGGIEPAQDANLDTRFGFPDEQIANTQRFATVPFEIHRRLETPADVINAMCRLVNGVIECSERLVAVHKRRVVGRLWTVFRLLHEPRQGYHRAPRARQRDGYGNRWLLGHGQASVSSSSS